MAKKRDRELDSMVEPPLTAPPRTPALVKGTALALAIGAAACGGDDDRRTDSGTIAPMVPPMVDQDAGDIIAPMIPPDDDAGMLMPMVALDGGNVDAGDLDAGDADAGELDSGIVPPMPPPVDAG